MRRESLDGVSVPKLIITILLALSLISCGVLGTPDKRESTARAFIQAVADRNEDRAISLSSSRIRTAVALYCPNGMVISCFDEAGMQEWGHLEDILFDYGTSPGTLAYSTVWSNEGIVIVVDTIQENGTWVVDGWRGLIPVVGEYPTGLIDGSNPINAFPPVK